MLRRSPKIWRGHKIPYQASQQGQINLCLSTADKLMHKKHPCKNAECALAQEHQEPVVGLPAQTRSGILDSLYLGNPLEFLFGVFVFHLVFYLLMWSWPY
jgi:hypothetical protein